MKIDILLDALALEVNLDNEPLPDIAICSQCGWRGSVKDCGEAEDGDWETGYYKIDACPICEDGGCIDDYDMTAEREKEWNEWYKKQVEND